MDHPLAGPRWRWSARRSVAPSVAAEARGTTPRPRSTRPPRTTPSSQGKTLIFGYLADDRPLHRRHLRPRGPARLDAARLRHGGRAGGRRSHQARRVLRHGLRRAGRRPRLRRVPDLRSTDRQRRDVHTTTAARPDPRDRRRPLLRRDRQADAMAVTNPSPLSIPVIVEQLPAARGQGHRGADDALLARRGDPVRPAARPAGVVPPCRSAPRCSSRRWPVPASLSLLVGARERSRSRAVWTPRTRCTPSSRPALDRTLLGLAVGAALGLAGALMQGLTRNPLADPGILGVNAGATFAMVLGDLGLRLLRTGAVPPVRLRRCGRRRWWRSTSSPRSDATARPRSSSPSPARPLTAGLASWTTGRAAGRPQDDGVLPASGRSARSAAAAPTCSSPGCRSSSSARCSASPARALLNTLALGDDLARGLGRRTTRDRLVIGARHRAARRHGDRAGRPDRLRRPRRAARRPRPRRPRPPHGAAVLDARLGAVLVVARRHGRPGRAAALGGAGRHHGRRRRRPGLPRPDPPRPGGRCEP